MYLITSIFLLFNIKLNILSLPTVFIEFGVFNKSLILAFFDDIISFSLTLFCSFRLFNKLSNFSCCCMIDIALVTARP